jgi:ABC-2 type transport system permease protein
MRASLSRIAHLVWKEIIQIGRDRRHFALILTMPILELTIFGYVASADLDQIELAVCDYSQSAESRSYVEHLERSGYFQVQAACGAVADVNRLLDRGLVTVALVIPHDFATRLKRGEPAQVMAAIDGSNSNTAMITASYLDQVTLTGAVDVIFPDRAAPQQHLHQPIVSAEPRVWFNPELRSVKFMVPGIICVLLMESMVVLTAMAIVREKELGTLEQLIVTPIRSFELIIGKAVPFVGIGYLNMVIVVLVGTYWFQVPIRGDLTLLFGLSGLFIFTCLGLGLLVSSISNTQQQAMLAGQFVLLPNLFFSGFMFPIASMPHAIQLVTYVMPLRYFITIARGIFLTGVGWAELRADATVLLVYGLVILATASLTFRKRVA